MLFYIYLSNNRGIIRNHSGRNVTSENKKVSGVSLQISLRSGVTILFFRTYGVIIKKKIFRANNLNLSLVRTISNVYHGAYSGTSACVVWCRGALILKLATLIRRARHEDDGTGRFTPGGWTSLPLLSPLFKGDCEILRGSRVRLIKRRSRVN